MPNDTAPAWPDPARPGVPLNPERDGWHWVEGLFAPKAILWRAKDRLWIEGSNQWRPAVMAATCDGYYGPALHPSEVAAHTAAAWLAAREACAAEADKARASYLKQQAGWPRQSAEWIGATEAKTAAYYIAATLRALTPPADAMAAMAEVVRREMEREREANASLAEHLADKGVDNGSWDEGITNWEAAHIIAAAIRARAGETKA